MRTISSLRSGLIALRFSGRVSVTHAMPSSSSTSTHFQLPIFSRVACRFLGHFLLPVCSLRELASQALDQERDHSHCAARRPVLRRAQTCLVRTRLGPCVAPACAGSIRRKWPRELAGVAPPPGRYRTRGLRPVSAGNRTASARTTPSKTHATTVERFTTLVPWHTGPGSQIRLKPPPSPVVNLKQSAPAATCPWQTRRRLHSRYPRSRSRQHMIDHDLDRAVLAPPTPQPAAATDLGQMPEWNLADLYAAPDAPEVARDSPPPPPRPPASRPPTRASSSRIGGRRRENRRSRDRLREAVRPDGPARLLCRPALCRRPGRPGAREILRRHLREADRDLVRPDLLRAGAEPDPRRRAGQAALQTPALAKYRPWFDDLRKEKPLPARGAHRAAVPREEPDRPRRLQPPVQRDHDGAALSRRRRGRALGAGADAQPPVGRRPSPGGAPRRKRWPRCSARTRGCSR